MFDCYVSSVKRSLIVNHADYFTTVTKYKVKSQNRQPNLPFRKKVFSVGSSNI